MPERTALYRFYDSDDTLLYVGITGTISFRWEQHARRQPWWPAACRQIVDWHPTREAAEAAERVAIQSERPLHNIAHSAKQAMSRAAPRPVPGGLTVGALRRSLADQLGQVQHGGGSIEITKNGKTAAYLVSPELFARLTQEDA